MNDRRKFFEKALPAAAAAAVSLAQPASAQDGDVREFLGGWTTIHSLPFPPNWFREFLIFSSGGGVHETNTFLNNASNLDFSGFGLPRSVSASDGLGTWERVGPRKLSVVFRKLLFDGARNYIGDLKVTGTVQSDGTKLFAEWHIVAVDVNDRLLVDLGPATSEGTRIK